MNIYRLSQSDNSGYDTYDSCVVAAESPDDARTIHPSEFVTHHRDGKWYGTHGRTFNQAVKGKEYETEKSYGSWVQGGRLDKIDTELMGMASEGYNRGVICASFNAG